MENSPRKSKGYYFSSIQGYTTYIYEPSIDDKSWLIVDTVGVCYDTLPPYLEQIIEYAQEMAPIVEYRNVNETEGMSFEKDKDF